MRGPQNIAMPGQVWGLAAPDPTGPLFVTSYDGGNLSATVVTALTRAGVTLWRREFAGHPHPPRVNASGTVWIAHREPPSQMFHELGADGSTLHSIVPEHEPYERLGAFVLLPDGICVAWLPAPRSRLLAPGRVSRVARYNDSGDCLWTTPIRLGEIAHDGVVEISEDSGWNVRPKKPWTPRTIEVDHWEPLLISGDRILASYTDGGSGIGVSSFLDLGTGQIVAATQAAPTHHKAILGPGEFLIGAQGYGVLSTARYDRDGTQQHRWPSHGMMLTDHHGAIRGPESENVLPSRSHFRGLKEDGTLRDGPALSGYYTTYPALDHAGTAVFWRDGRLLTVDSDFELRELFASDDQRSVMSRILLLDQGQIVFALCDELLLFRDTGLGPLDTSTWPCGDSNLHGNPATHLTT